MADQYLQGLRPEKPQIHLQRWEEPSVILWFSATAPPEPLLFARAIAAYGKQVERMGIRILSGGYVRTLDLADGLLLAEVGFRVKPGIRRLPDGARVEAIAPIPFVTLECALEDDQSAHRIWSSCMILASSRPASVWNDTYRESQGYTRYWWR